MEEKRIAGSIILNAPANGNIKSEKAANRLKALEIAISILPKMKKREGYESIAKDRIEVLTESKEIAEDIFNWAYGK